MNILQDCHKNICNRIQWINKDVQKCCHILFIMHLEKGYLNKSATFFLPDKIQTSKSSMKVPENKINSRTSETVHFTIILFFLTDIQPNFREKKSLKFNVCFC